LTSPALTRQGLLGTLRLREALGRVSPEEEDIARLSPARYERINPYGKYRFEVEEGLSRSRLRPLRPPTEQQSW